MLLTIDDEHAEHLRFLKDAGIDIVREFCRISIEFIKKGTNPKMYGSAAQKLGVESTDVEHSIQGLMFLFSEAAKHNLTDGDFHDSVLAMGFVNEAAQKLVEEFTSHKRELRMVLTEMSPDLPHYENLQWRLDIQLGSRSLHHQIEPQILMKLHTKEGDVRDVISLQTDPVNLLHLTQTLESALQELKSSHARRILRNI